MKCKMRKILAIRQRPFFSNGHKRQFPCFMILYNKKTILNYNLVIINEETRFDWKEKLNKSVVVLTNIHHKHK